MTDTIPSGLTLTSMTGTGWGCTNNLCTRNDALNAGAGYPAITVMVNVAANATSPQVNLATVSGGGSATAGATDSTTIQTAGSGSTLTASATSVTTVPNTAQGASAIFTFKFSDTSGASSLTTVSAMISSTAAGPNTAREHLARGGDDTRALLRQIFQTEADLTPDLAANTLTVKLHHLTQAAHDQAIEKLR